MTNQPLKTNELPQEPASHDQEPPQVLANWNGRQMPLSDVKVSVLDRAFLFGDAIYEVLRIYGGHLFRFSDHMDRMRNGLRALKIQMDDLSEVERHICETLANSGVQDGIVYIQITRGEAPRMHRYPDSCKPNVLIYVDHLKPVSAQVRADGIKVITHPDIRWGRNDIKQTGLTANCMVAQVAAEKGCQEAIMIDAQGLVTEGTHTTIFGVKDGTILVPPPSPKVLPGITKMQILELARNLGIAVELRWMTSSELFNLDEVFLASTIQEALAIVAIDDRPVASGKPGPILMRVQDAFEEIVAHHR